MARVFDFGKNWRTFVENLSAAQRHEARASLQQNLRRTELSGLRFLDIGCGSGLFSLAARELGATVVSFDLDGDSVACTQAMKERYAASDPQWTIVQGSVLDADFVDSLGSCDIVYSWGVLHHTASLWRAIAHATRPLRTSLGGLLSIAIYNRHWSAPGWKLIKATYNTLPRPLQSAMLGALAPVSFLGAWWTTGRPPLSSGRGMRFWVDLRDWVGGYPYEYASPAEVQAFVEALGFHTLAVRPTAGWTGCNELLFERDAAPS